MTDKNIEKLKELNEKLKAREISEFPPVVPIDTVSLCNYRCSMCIHDKMKRKRGFMEWNLYKKIIDEIASENKDTMVYMVYYGEPLVRAKVKPNIFELIKYAKSKGLTNVVTNTNGGLLTEENAIKLIESGIDEIIIGIDAMNQKTYAENRVGGDYEKTVNNILKLIDIKDNRKLAKPIISVQFIEMDNNIGQKDDFIKFWKKAGADVKIRKMITWGRKNDRACAHVKQGEDVQEYRHPCMWALTVAAILNTGEVVCAADLDGEYSFGNIYENTIKEVWNGEKMKNFRKYHQSNQWNKLHELCKNCPDWRDSTTDIKMEND